MQNFPIYTSKNGLTTLKIIQPPNPIQKSTPEVGPTHEEEKEEGAGNKAKAEVPEVKTEDNQRDPPANDGANHSAPSENAAQPHAHIEVHASEHGHAGGEHETQTFTLRLFFCIVF